MRSIGLAINRSASTVSRELRRVSDNAQDCKARGSLSARGLVASANCPHTASPLPNDASIHVSHETIYKAIYLIPRGELRRALVACLRQGRSTRKPRTRGEDRRGKIPDMQSIHVRPPEVQDRLIPGHWEGDLIKGSGNRSSLGTLVERTTGCVVLPR